MDQLYLQHLGVTKRPGGDYLLTLRWFDAHGHLHEAACETDLNLGHIMAAFSACLKRIYAIESGQGDVVTTSYGGPIDLTSWTISELRVAPFRWQMQMATARFSYDCNIDANLEHVILAFSGALKFFAFKHGLTTLEDDHVRSRDRAGELGLLTKEDFHA
jgi:hypothetical protein